jgi:hypothetical protein
MKEAQVPPKRWFLQEPQGVTSQKTPFFIVTAVQNSNLTEIWLSLFVLEPVMKIVIQTSNLNNCPYYG